MSDNPGRASQLMNSLELSLPPIAISFCDDVDPKIPPYDGIVPAGCVFWQEAATQTFSTSATDHELCSIGVHTHHMSQVGPSQQSELQETLQAMIGLDYVRAEEVVAIPVMQHEVRHVVYGPLADFPLDIDVVLLFAHAQQGLILSEAVGRVDGGVAPAMGRPACAVVPQVVNSGRAAMSLGCCGARAYLDKFSDSVSLWALPGSNLDRYCEQIAVFAHANMTLTAFHDTRRTQIESAERPTMRESLQRLSI